MRPATSTSPARRHAFRSMGTDVTLLGAVDPGSHAADGTFAGAARKVERVFARMDGRFTRFTHASELSGVNARAGTPTRVSRAFAEVLRLSLEAAARTEGLFDPTILPALLAVGYDRDFDEVIAGGRLALNPPVPCGRWREVELEGDVLHMPEEVSLDFGGIAKGWTADRAARKAARSLQWALVAAGGDLRMAGEVLPPGGVEIGVEDPRDPSAEILRLRLEHGALATSSVTVRAWGPGRHHLIDPRTGAPADTGVVQATAWGPTCAEAEVRSKWALLGGEAVLNEVPAALVYDDGHVVVSMDACQTEGAPA
ncbi:MAG TPA: FAD:protein FMN transferase [Actinomycetota bacterium]